jgi:hypothetical protein
VIWHIARFDMSSLDDETREELEEQLAGLAVIDEVAFLRMARDLNEPNVTGFLTAFADLDAFARYEEHPVHVPVVTRVKELGLPVVHLDFPADDDPADLP